MFCLPCWLFSKSPGIWGASNGGCKFFKNGLHRIESHENSKTHKSAEKELLLTRYCLFNDKTIIKSFANMEMKEIENNRKILNSILDSVFYLARQGLPLRGDREYQGLGPSNINEGNFLELIKMLSKHDLFLEKHLHTSDRNATYLSPQIQNELIECLAKEMLSKIKL